MRGKRLGAAIAAGLGVAAAVAIAAALGVFTHSHTASALGSRADGVKVHGQWTIVVRSTSGKIVSRHSFHNDLVTGASINTGSSALADVMSGQFVASDWAVMVQDDACSEFHECLILEPDADTFTWSSHIIKTTNLSVTVPTSGDNAYQIVLQGSITQPADGSITGVGSDLQVCKVSADADKNCPADQLVFTNIINQFTTRTLASPISALNGQEIQVTVDISFS